MNKKRILQVTAAACLMVMGLAACGQKDSSTQDGGTAGTNNQSEITVVSRDSASGTRSAFHELLNITVKEGDTEIDKLVTGSLEFDSTDKVITAVEGDQNCIGYISMGSISDRIKALNIDGIAPTAENVKNGSYKISRPFLLLTKQGDQNETVQDFLAYALSQEGQETVQKSGYITDVESPKAYTPSGKSGTIKISGSTSVEPLMQKLIEGYKALNPNVTFEMQAQGSSQGIKGATEGTADIGMSSRELKEEEKSALTSTTLALDGIAVIVNKDNSKTSLSADTITKIYTGAVTAWGQAN